MSKVWQMLSCWFFGTVRLCNALILMSITGPIFLVNSPPMFGLASPGKGPARHVDAIQDSRPVCYPALLNIAWCHRFHKCDNIHSIRCSIVRPTSPNRGELDWSTHRLSTARSSTAHKPPSTSAVSRTTQNHKSYERRTWPQGNLLYITY